MLLFWNARLKAGRWPSRSVSASTPSQSKRIASGFAMRDDDDDDDGDDMGIPLWIGVNADPNADSVDK